MRKNKTDVVIVLFIANEYWKVVLFGGVSPQRGSCRVGY